MNSNSWLIALGIGVLAFGLLFGSALADPGNPFGEDNGEPGQGMSAQMDPETYGQMIQRMVAVHGAEFTTQMLQQMNRGGDWHGDGQGMVGGQSFGGMMNGGSMMGGGMMGR